MSFWTSVQYCYPAVKPPVVTTLQLADLFERVQALEWLEASRFPSLKVKFGKKIDLNRRSLTEEVPTSMPRISRLRTQALDISLSPRDNRREGDTVDALRKQSRSIYRAFINLGSFSRAMTEKFNYQTDENPQGVFLDGLSFEVGPVNFGTLNDDRIDHVGWMSLSVSGPGYCYPVQPHEVMRDVRTDERIEEVVDIVRELWPVPPRRPSRQIIKHRNEMGDRFGGVSPDEPLDWFWMISDS